MRRVLALTSALLGAILAGPALAAGSTHSAPAVQPVAAQHQRGPLASDGCEIRSVAAGVAWVGRNECEFRATAVGGYNGVGPWLLQVAGPEGSVEYRGSGLYPTCAQPGVILPGDVVRLSIPFDATGRLKAGAGVVCPGTASRASSRASAPSARQHAPAEVQQHAPADAPAPGAEGCRVYVPGIAVGVPPYLGFGIDDTGAQHCSYDATKAGGYQGHLNWQLDITRRGEAIHYMSTGADKCAPAGTIMPGDHVLLRAYAEQVGDHAGQVLVGGSSIGAGPDYHCSVGGAERTSTSPPRGARAVSAAPGRQDAGGDSSAGGPEGCRASQSGDGVYGPPAWIGNDDLGPATYCSYDASMAAGFYGNGNWKLEITRRQMVGPVIVVLPITYYGDGQRSCAPVGTIMPGDHVYLTTHANQVDLGGSWIGAGPDYHC